MAKSEDVPSSQEGGSQPDVIDWVAMEPEYIANIISVRALAKKYNCSDKGIAKHFNKLGIKRNPKQKIREKAEEKVRKAEVHARDASKKATDLQQIEVAADNQAQLILNHRTDIQSKRLLVEKLYAEVNELTDGKLEIKKILKELLAGNQKGAFKMLGKVSSLDSRIKGVKDLQKAFASLLALERQAFGINDDDGDLGDNPKEGKWLFEAIAVKKGD